MAGGGAGNPWIMAANRAIVASISSIFSFIRFSVCVCVCVCVCIK